LKTKKPVPPLKVKKPPFEILIIGIKKEKEELKKLIKKRLLKRLKQGLVKEVKNLRKSGISWKRLESFGLEYKFVAQYLQDKLNYQEMVEKLQKEIEKFAKRQMTWFKKFKNIHWIKTEKEAKKLIDSFLNK
ncbi:MAG: tRNA (adenosine(37)-N6)-dimethylallyltransferase MiaA, partial [Candidatus Heimdallarchaeota archaeon]